MRHPFEREYPVHFNREWPHESYMRFEPRRRFDVYDPMHMMAEGLYDRWYDVERARRELPPPWRFVRNEPLHREELDAFARFYGEPEPMMGRLATRPVTEMDVMGPIYGSYPLARSFGYGLAPSYLPPFGYGIAPSPLPPHAYGIEPRMPRYFAPRELVGRPITEDVQIFLERLRELAMSRAEAMPRLRRRGPKGWRRPDERILEEVNERMAREPWLDASDITVRVESGEVTLEGTVPTRHDKRLAEEIAMTVFGVEDVHNRVRIKRDEDVASVAGIERREKTRREATA